VSDLVRERKAYLISIFSSCILFTIGVDEDMNRVIEQKKNKKKKKEKKKKKKKKKKKNKKKNKMNMKKQEKKKMMIKEKNYVAFKNDCR
jgi:hypothetical protein